MRFFIVLSVLCLISQSGIAQGTSSSNASTAAQRGKDTFHEYCAVCHGERGKGDGPAAAALSRRPADLSTLARQNGAFPATHIQRVLKSTDPVVAHGSSGMMVWGSMFLADANGDQRKADARIADVVTFIESIQAK